MPGYTNRQRREPLVGGPGSATTITGNAPTPRGRGAFALVRCSVCALPTEAVPEGMCPDCARAWANAGVAP